MIQPYFIAAGLALAWVIVEMTLTHAVARRLRNNGIVDVVWSAGFAPLAVVYLAVAAAHSGIAVSIRSAVLVAMVVAWSLRLAIHLAIRVRAHHPHEDVRYAELRREWGPDVDRRMYGFFLLQGGIQWILSVPWLLVVLAPGRQSGGASFGLFESLAIALWFIGLAGESVADRQLARFKADPANRGQVCRSGLWRYSRHPNYFFEWMIWVAYFVYACAVPWGWIGVIAPALMWHFLNNVTGIPMTEALSVRSRGDAYREYQRTTSPFFPWFPKSDRPT